jgi:hypothetical protein
MLVKSNLAVYLFVIFLKKEKIFQFDTSTKFVFNIRKEEKKRLKYIT